MKKSLIFSLLSLILLVSCKKDADDIGKALTEELDFGPFMMNATKDWKGFKLQGIDSYVGGVSDGKDTLMFDYGWYSGNFSYLSDKEYIKTSKKIDGKDAEVVRPRVTGKGVLGIRIAVDKFNSLKMQGVSKNEKVVLQMFDSIRFK